MELTGAILGDDITTMDIRHRVHEGLGYAYFFAKFPAGDYAIHSWRERDQAGYGGRMISFLMVDGSYRTVRGPFIHMGYFDHGIPQMLAATLREPELANRATKLVVGEGLLFYNSTQKRVVVHAESDWHLGDWKQRLKPEWSGLTVAVVSRSGTSYSSVDKILQELQSNG